jgi:hypothetical protein
VGLNGAPVSSKQIGAFLLAAAKSPNENRFAVDGVVNTEPLTQTDVVGISGASSMMVALPETSTADDALLAIGAALAGDVPTVFLVKDKKKMPWLLREADQVRPDKIAVVERGDGKDLQGRIARAFTDMAHAQRPDQGRHEGAVDTFLGSVMSGLNETQYAQGRELLQVIDGALKAQGSLDNFSEALRIKDSSNYDTPADSLKLDVNAMNASKNAVFFVFDDNPRPSSMWIEAGFAIARALPTTFLVPHTSKGLPPALQASDLGTQKIAYGSHDAMKSEVGKHHLHPRA